MRNEMSRVEFEVESITCDNYEWLVCFREIDVNDGSSEVYVVSICVTDIDFEENSINYIHIENIDYLYHISGGDERIIETCHEIFKVIEREVIEEIKSFL